VDIARNAMEQFLLQGLLVEAIFQRRDGVREENRTEWLTT
jgi:hypothetical protein